jgi:hypothetical protein
MVVTDTFVEFARRMAVTQGCRNVAIAVTKNPLRALDAQTVKARAQDMMKAIVEGLTEAPDKARGEQR